MYFNEHKDILLLQCWKRYGENVWYWTETFGEGRRGWCFILS